MYLLGVGDSFYIVYTLCTYDMRASDTRSGYCCGCSFILECRSSYEFTYLAEDSTLVFIFILGRLS